MRKIILLSAIYCLNTFNSAAQEKKNKKYQFHSINSIALVNGDNGATGALQTINGFTKGSWFAGVGLGLDYYQYRSVPLFADVRYELGSKKNKPFVYGNAGINMEWTQDYFFDEPSIWNANSSSQFKNGFYSDAGIGISAEFKNGNAFLLSLGISRKTLKEIITYEDWRTGQTTEQINSYRFNRIIFKAGLKF